MVPCVSFVALITILLIEETRRVIFRLCVRTLETNDNSSSKISVFKTDSYRYESYKDNVALYSVEQITLVKIVRTIHILCNV